MKNYLFAISAVFLFASAAAAADRTDPLNPTFYACRLGIGDFRTDLCGNADGSLNCNYNEEAIAKVMCTINTSQGPITAPHDTPVPALFHAGENECGVTTYRVTCHRTSPAVLLSDAGAVTVYAGHTVEQTALAYCKGIKTPTDKFTAFTTYDHSGGGHGFTYIRVMCFK